MSSRSRSRASKYYRHNKHDIRSSRNKSRSFSYSQSRSRSRSRSRSHSINSNHSNDAYNYSRENAELPQDHPLFNTVKKNKQKQKKLEFAKEKEKGMKELQLPLPNTKYHKTNESFRGQRSDRAHHRYDRHRDNRDHRDRHDHHHRGDKDRHPHRDRHEREHNRDHRDRHNESDERGHNYHTGHKQQILKKQKQKKVELPQITTEQAQQIKTVTAVVQKQEEISFIVETQQRKLAQKTSLQKIKEKILLQKQQMIQRKNNHKNKQNLAPNNIGTIFQTENRTTNHDSNNFNSISGLHRKAIENLSEFVSAHGIALEQTVRERSRDDPKFSWLYDKESLGYSYYQYLLKNKSKTENETSEMAQKLKKRKRRRFSSQPSMDSNNSAINNNNNSAMDKMNAYISALQSKEKEKVKDTRFDRSNQMSIFNGGDSHHIGHYLPEDELGKFNDRKRGYMPAKNEPISGRNKGHAMLKKLGWNEGKGLGKNEQGFLKPISEQIQYVSGGKQQSHKPWDPKPGDNKYDLYQKKMMLSYRYRPNPLGNPRKDYY